MGTKGLIRRGALGRSYGSLRAWRQAHGLRQADAAKRFGVSQTRWSRIERGKLRPKNVLVKTLMAQTGVPLEVLLGISL